MESPAQQDWKNREKINEDITNPDSICRLTGNCPSRRRFGSFPKTIRNMPHGDPGGIPAEKGQPPNPVDKLSMYQIYVPAPNGFVIRMGRQDKHAPAYKIR